MVVIELASRKLIRMVMQLKGPELMTLLCTNQRRSRVLEYSPVNKLCTVPDDCSGHPWYVEWIAAQFTGKHLHTMRSRPSLDSVRQDIMSFVSKLKWKSVHMDDDDTDRPVVKIKRPVPPIGNAIVPPELLAWCGLFKRRILRAICCGVEKGGSYNTSELYVWALQRLRLSDWCLMPNDKEGSYSIMTLNDYRRLQLDVLSGGNYESIESIDGSSIRRLGNRLTKRVVEWSGDTRWWAAVAKGWRDSSLFGKLTLLLKSHKPEGQVTCRAIHALPSFSLEGLAKWLMLQRRTLLPGPKHLISSSKMVVDRVSRIAIENNYCVMVKVDIKHFYVVGQHHLLAEALAKLFADPMLKSIIFDVAHYLLDNQYIIAGSSRYKVREGCGIGLMHAGNMADMIYYSMVEKCLISNNSFVDAGVIGWFRFRDDMLFILKKGQSFKTLFNEMTRLSGCFKLNIEEISTIQIRYLDIVIRRGDVGFETVPFLKDPRLSRRLAMISAHPREVHTAWPTMMLRRVQSLSKSHSANSAFGEELRKRLTSDGCFVPAHHMRCIGKSSPDLCNILWLPIGHHPWWYRVVKRAVHQFNSCTDNLSLLKMGLLCDRPVVRVAWKNMLPRTNSLLKPTGWRLG